MKSFKITLKTGESTVMEEEKGRTIWDIIKTGQRGIVQVRGNEMVNINENSVASVEEIPQE
jgi:hypothetical protein